MKKIPILFSLLLLGLILSSCRFFNEDTPPVNESVSSQKEMNSRSKKSTSSNEMSSSSNDERSASSDTAKETTTENQVADYFPETANKQYVYVGEGNEYASYNVFTDYEANNRKQTRTNNGGTEVVKVLALEENQLIVLLNQGEIYTRENCLERQTTNENEEIEILIKKPIKAGTSWETIGERTRSITAINVSVTTPVGTFETIEVTTEGTEDKEMAYYAPNIGLVKSVFASEGYNVTSTLSEIKDASLVQIIRFYYPESDGETMSFVDKKVTFKTNDVTRKKIEEAYKEVPNDKVGNVLSKNAKILSLYLNKDGHVYVDVSKELTSEMNAGSAFETLIIQSLVNTIGGYYYTNEVYLTVEGKPYSTGHIQMKKGEPFIVDTKSSHDLQK
ncbi:GerMN domain-containing protein [Carnobacterium funditum]|uniref:GerMN domain-containing protein n=1 Tax=Carnobacterium funditum TaxID=2752 RepID=UPI0005531213|nr:GerMN domain-containing protein [Carnobacterium funditum]